MMSRQDELQDLNQRLNSIIETQCNPIGCDNCGLKFGFDKNAECSATHLNGKIMEIEMRELMKPMREGAA